MSPLACAITHRILIATRSAHVPSARAEASPACCLSACWVLLGRADEYWLAIGSCKEHIPGQVTQVHT